MGYYKFTLLTYLLTYLLQCFIGDIVVLKFIIVIYSLHKRNEKLQQFIIYVSPDFPHTSVHTSTE